PLTLVEVETQPPPAGHVRLAVAACGVCGTDREFLAGHFPGLQLPITLGHEMAGPIAEVGDGVEDFAVGDRVAVGWFGGNCNRCIP
ncbi:alcohol dehydrogenase, partial [Mycobacterium sp. ITM-2017-0098]